MKKTGIIFACIGSAGVGSLITYILTRRHFQKKLESFCLNCKEGRLEVPYTVTTAETQPSDWSKEWQQAVNAQLKKEPEEPAEEPEEETEPEEEVDDISIDPYETTAEEFMASEEKMYFTVYKDEVIADDKDKVVRNPEYYIGKDILGRLFSKIGDDPLYVCNPVLNVVIEIAYSLDDYGA